MTSAHTTITPRPDDAETGVTAGPVLDPAGFFRRIPLLPHQMTSRRTATSDVIVLCHLGVPRITTDAWRLTIDGLVARPVTLDFERLKSFPKVSIETVHQCAGSPLQPEVPARRISNVVWAGVRLADVLALAQPQPAARFAWSYGADYGAFDNVPCDAYLKDFPLSRLTEDVLIAHELNGAALPPEHGYPARLVIPGFYGTNSVKWLTRLTLAAERADSAFTTRWYNDPELDEGGQPTGARQPVWSIAPESVIVTPAPDGRIAAGTLCAVTGWAWADGGVDRLEVSCDGGASWQPAALEAPSGRAWQGFRYDWIPTTKGPATLMARAHGRRGGVQPQSGRRNAIHCVPITIV